MRDSDWSRENLLRSDWLGPRVAIYTTNALYFTALPCINNPKTTLNLENINFLSKSV